MSEPWSEEVRCLGFNTDVEHDATTFHVQTEIIGRDELKVKTSVLLGGVVRFYDTRPCPTHKSNLQDLRELIEALHLLVVERVRQGEIR